MKDHRQEQIIRLEKASVESRSRGQLGGWEVKKGGKRTEKITWSWEFLLVCFVVVFLVGCFFLGGVLFFHQLRKIETMSLCQNKDFV